ncbi:hypothetical protein SARC_00969 [Sphaeroforma arctica JP610]|uniref:Uncharacterized protein n=1 Tax=Sphaeroforma arctica JP610 TaxID=667725 RepID=A0A0L0GD88_9EUKA|nr:hypothetical protein SARC_00969 [Sphaeroforma arctica JP610]KNC86874.1 hypothetical protein SARC_00969 [Sphaeroforma arctica JP610]|eukprot:XP_014160776.1 hypothetical protein SARC_00969 [Sphaeroforma arctica JP610]
MLETNDIAPQQWIAALMQSFDPTGTSYLILQRHQHQLDTCSDWPAVCCLVTFLLSKDMRDPGLSSILTEPVENTPIQSYILKLDADLKRPDITKNKAQKWYEFLAMHVFCKNIGNNDRESLYTELRRKYATEVRDKGHETKFHLSRLKWEQTSDDKPHQTPPNQTRTRDAAQPTRPTKRVRAEPKDKEPPYKEIKKCADAQCGYDMYQLTSNDYWNGRHTPNCTHFLSKCDKCEMTNGYHAKSCDKKPDIKLE